MRLLSSNRFAYEIIVFLIAIALLTAKTTGGGNNWVQWNCVFVCPSICLIRVVNWMGVWLLDTRHNAVCGWWWRFAGFVGLCYLIVPISLISRNYLKLPPTATKWIHTTTTTLLKSHPPIWGEKCSIVSSFHLRFRYEL